MRVKIFTGETRDVSFDELESTLLKRHEEIYQTIWLMHECGPEIAIMVNDKNASVTYFPMAGHPGFQSIRQGDAKFGDVQFLADNYEPTSMPSEYCVCYEDAVNVVRDFWNSGERSIAIGWSEL